MYYGWLMPVLLLKAGGCDYSTNKQEARRGPTIKVTVLVFRSATVHTVSTVQVQNYWERNLRTKQ